MEKYPFQLSSDIFRLTAAEKVQMDALVQQVRGSTDEADHKMLGQQLADPIRQVADYVSWTEPLFMRKNYGDNENNRLAKDSYLAVAFYTSPTGQVHYVRPGRAYVQPEWTGISAGIEIGWRTEAKAGWNLLARKQLEASEELARKTDALATTVLNASITASGNNTNTAAGGVLTKAAVDTALATMAARGFPAKIVVCNSADAMDMTNWTLANSLLRWTPEQVGDLTTALYWAHYGNAVWLASPWAPASTVYLSAGPDKTGWHQTCGGTITASDIDITKMTDRHMYYKEDAFYIENDYALHTITVVA